MLFKYLLNKKWIETILVPHPRGSRGGRGGGGGGINMIYKENINADVLIQFLEQLIKSQQEIHG